MKKKEIQAAYFGTHFDEVNVGKATIPLSNALKLPYIPVTRVENYCATATEAFRAACYSVASGVYDIALALGVEKLKDTGYGGLPGGSGFGVFASAAGANATAPGMFALLATAYAKEYNRSMDEIKRAIAHVSAKSHANGALNPKAHLRKPVTEEQIMAAPMIAYPLGLFDCCGVSDGSACAIVTTPEIARSLKKNGDFVMVKALQISVSSGEEAMHTTWDGAHLETTTRAAAKAYEEAGIKNPREEISMMEVHDCFSITELVTMEDLQISPRGKAVDDVMNGFYDLQGGGGPLPGGRRPEMLWPSHRGLRHAHAVRHVRTTLGTGARGTGRERSAYRPDPQPGRHPGQQRGQHRHHRPRLIRRFP